MKFQLDTEDMETIKLTFSYEDLENELSENIQDFRYRMAAFFVDFAQKIGCDTKKALELRDLCFSCAGNDVEALLHAGILDEARPENASIMRNIKNYERRCRKLASAVAKRILLVRFGWPKHVEGWK